MTGTCQLLKTTPRGNAFTELLLVVLSLHGQLMAAGEDITRPVGLSSARWQVLGVVEHGPVTVADIAKAMGLARQSVQQVSDALDEDGFVTSQHNPRHRRAKLVALTDKGQKALDIVIDAQRSWATRIAKAATLEGLKSATEVLSSLQTALLADELRGRTAEGSIPAPRLTVQT